MTIDIHTDGSCLGNPGPGGWGAIVVTDGAERELSGGDAHTTNQRMEVTAAIKGLETVPASSAVMVHSDSLYLINTMTKGWKRKANVDLWPELDALVRERTVTWRWVKAHAGHAMNERADGLAVAAAYAAAGRPQARIAGAAPPEPGLSHLDAEGRAQMVDVSGKPDSDRTATAAGVVTMKPETLAMIIEGTVEKGDVFTVARIAGISAAKRTWDLIPLAHNIPLGQVTVDFETDAAKGTVAITATARTNAKTGVEMEALTAVSLAALTIYDMCKAVDRGMRIGDVRLLEKRGGVHGDYAAG
ncbi:MAG: cyclic pyranopterin monophosphate synthase MoaC [Chloroflexi bacterium]|nr:cyclic pyranopterin monophosphate synthase MoaC [Chloroflexota bacterium]